MYKYNNDRLVSDSHSSSLMRMARFGWASFSKRNDANNQHPVQSRVFGGRRARQNAQCAEVNRTLQLGQHTAAWERFVNQASTWNHSQVYTLPADTVQLLHAELARTPIRTAQAGVGTSHWAHGWDSSPIHTVMHRQRERHVGCGH
jgi:hypothetical protein